MRNALAIVLGVLAVLLAGCSTAGSSAPEVTVDPASTVAPPSDSTTTSAAPEAIRPTLSHTPVRTFTYVVRNKNVPTVDVNEFATHVDTTLHDPRGWALDGYIDFRQTEDIQRADLTIWIAAASELPNFSASCSVLYSCRIEDDVVINADRWTAPPDIGLDADEYRHMVVNHEVGHWLGFGHTSCPASGGQARIMQQQSKGGSFLGGCTAYPWPSEVERKTVASQYGLTL